MRLLVLGGTRFVGQTIVESALMAGWEVTTFNRGLSGTDVPRARVIRGDRTQVADLDHLAAGSTSYDAVIDTSGFVPCDVLAVCQRLHGVAAQYVFMSTVSVYRGWPVEPLSEASDVLYCPPDAGPDYGQDIENGPSKYGYQKSGCELAVTTTFGPERSTILRPGVVLGPREYVGRLPWWLNRVAHGGMVLAPGSPDRTIQPIDVGDLAAFVQLAVEQHITGTYNVTAPKDRETFGRFLHRCATVTRSDAEFIWVPDEDLLSSGVRQWSEIPLWRTFPGVWQIDSTAAMAKGLTSRPLDQTVYYTWQWMRATNEDLNWDDERAAEIGITRQREEQVLADYLRRSQATSHPGADGLV